MCRMVHHQLEEDVKKNIIMSRNLIQKNILLADKRLLTEEKTKSQSGDVRKRVIRYICVKRMSRISQNRGEERTIYPMENCKT